MTLKIASAQINLLVGDVAGNATRIITCAQHILQTYPDVDLILFPELALSGYPPEDLLFRPALYQRCQEALHTILAAKLPTTLIIGLPTQEIQTLQSHYLRYNSAAVISQGELIHLYHKQELPNYEVFDEVRYFTAGYQNGIIVIKNVAIAILICEDLWKPAPLQHAVLAGAQVAVCINASPFDRHKAQNREQILRQRAIEGKIPIVYCNLIGGQDELVFDGGSLSVNPDGNRAQQGKYFAEDILLTEIDLQQTLPIKTSTVLSAASEEENLYQALLLGVRDYIQKNHFPGAIIGLSGGIDSALTLCIAVDALGADKVRVVLMPSRYTATMSIDDALQQAKILKVHYDIIDIEPLFTAYLNSLAPVFHHLPKDTTEENLQARIRGNILMALSNKFGAIVLTTGNKSELSVGYATLYGDMAGGFSVLKDIPKTLVYQLAHYRNRITTVIPGRVLTRAPSAELAENQKDQDSLPPYDILDEIIHLYIEKDRDPQDIYSEKLDSKTVDRVVKMINRNEYKRRQAPIGIRTTVRAFGKDRRYPITSGYHNNSN